MIHFRYDPTVHITSPALLYVPGDYAFTADPRPEGCALSVSVNELQLMVDEEDHRVVFVEGYCPHVGWQARKLTAPRARQAGLFVVFGEEPVPGVSRRVSGDARWPAVVDPRSGWVCVGQEAVSISNVALEFAPGTVAVVDPNGRLVSLWLRPEHLPRDVAGQTANGGS